MAEDKILEGSVVSHLVDEEEVINQFWEQEEEQVEECKHRRQIRLRQPSHHTRALLVGPLASPPSRKL